MVNKYKKIVLLKGLEAISDYHFSLIKSLMARDLRLTRKTQEEYDRIKIADLMEDEFRSDAGLSKLIELFKDIPELGELAETLRKEKLKVKGKTPAGKKKQEEAGSAILTSTTSNILPFKGMEVTPKAQKINDSKEKSGTKRKMVSGEQFHSPCPAGASVSTPTIHFPPAQTLSWTPSSTSSVKVATKRTAPRTDPMIVMVLKATEPFEYESSEEGTNKMFHATVVTESQFFQVKIFNINLKEKFTKKKIITICDYFEHKGILEIREASSVFEAGPDQKLEVPARVIKRANETPKIDHLQKGISGIIVYGLFKLQKKKVKRKNTIYEIQDNTGKIDVVGNGKWHNIKCEEGDKLRLFCFEMRKIDKMLKLVSGSHSFIKVIKSTKNKKRAINVNLSLEAEVANSPNQLTGFNNVVNKVESFF